MIVWIILGVILFLIVVCSFAWYRIVPPTEAHLVVTPRKKMIVASDESIATDGKKTYFAIPSTIPFFGRKIRKMDLTIKEIVLTQESYEENQARFNVKSSTKFRIVNVLRAAETWDNDEDLKNQLMEVIVSSTNAIASHYNVTDMRSKKQEMSEAIQKEMVDDLKQWGLELTSFQLIDFADTEHSKIISDISKRREVEIESRTREENAEKIKQARIKEAEAEELAKQREIAKDQVIGEREQNRNQKISEQKKLAKEKEFEVIRVEEVKRAEIDKEKAIVKANENKLTEEIKKEQKQLEGQGDRLRAEEQAKGLAAPIREKGFAEAEAKEKLQAALNKFGDSAIRALVAEKIVAMQEAVGVETAKALSQADVKVFAGGEGDAKSGFDLGKIISSMSASNEGTAQAVLNKIARPNDLGLNSLDLKSVINNINKDKISKEPVKKVTESKSTSTTKK